MSSIIAGYKPYLQPAIKFDLMKDTAAFSIVASDGQVVYLHWRQPPVEIFLHVLPQVILNF